MQLNKRIQKEWNDLLLGQFTPQSIALGLGLGTFVALLPTFGFSALISFLLILLFPKMNRPAIFLALIIWNPIVQIPIYALSFKLGSMLFAGMPLVEYDLEILNQLYVFSRRFLIGHMMITTTITFVVYITSLLLLKSKTIK